MASQLVLEFPKPVRVPDEGTQCGKLLRAFQRGESLTVAEALTKYGIYALSQRCGELKLDGWPIVSEPFKTAGGARVAKYYMARRA